MQKITHKKILSLLLSLVMILTALPLSGVTAFAVTNGDFEYTILADGTAEITKYNGSAETLIIPSKLDTYTVTSIGRHAFAYCSSLTSITIPESVTSIGGSAFYECHSLTSVTIPKSVTSIGRSAFDDTGYYNNPSNWENGVLYIDNCLIEANNTEIPENYTINEGTRVIADSAFAYCGSLTSVTIPESVISIGNYAFAGCFSLAGVTIPDSVTSIGEDAFDYCYSLTDIYILNKDCFIVSSEYSYPIPTKTTIHGYTGSTAEEYAKEYGNNFVVIEDEPVPPDDPTKPDKPVTPDEPNAIGDVDGNTNITITDAKWILQNTVKSRNLTEAQAKAADLNKDGKVTIVDAKWVLQIVVGLRDAQTLKPIKK